MASQATSSDTTATQRQSSRPVGVSVGAPSFPEFSRDASDILAPASSSHDGDRVSRANERERLDQGDMRAPERRSDERHRERSNSPTRRDPNTRSRSTSPERRGARVERSTGANLSQPTIADTRATREAESKSGQGRNVEMSDESSYDSEEMRPISQMRRNVVQAAEQAHERIIDGVQNSRQFKNTTKLCDTLDEALGIDDRANSPIASAKLLPRGGIYVQMHTAEGVQRLESADLGRFGPEAAVHELGGARDSAQRVVLIFVSGDMTDDDIKSWLSREGYTVVSAERPRWHAGAAHRGSNVFVRLQNEDEAKRLIDAGSVRMAYQRVRVEAPRERDKHVMCYRCAKFGHIAAMCDNEASCAICAGNHAKHECDQPTTRARPRCARCGGEHQMWSRECPHHPSNARARGRPTASVTAPTNNNKPDRQAAAVNSRTASTTMLQQPANLTMAEAATEVRTASVVYAILDKLLAQNMVDAARTVLRVATDKSVLVSEHEAALQTIVRANQGDSKDDAPHTSGIQSPEQTPSLLQQMGITPTDMPTTTPQRAVHLGATIAPTPTMDPPQSRTVATGTRKPIRPPQLPPPSKRARRNSATAKPSDTRPRTTTTPHANTSAQMNTYADEPTTNTTQTSAYKTPPSPKRKPHQPKVKQHRRTSLSKPRYGGATSSSTSRSTSARTRRTQRESAPDTRVPASTENRQSGGRATMNNDA